MSKRLTFSLVALLLPFTSLKAAEPTNVIVGGMVQTRAVWSSVPEPVTPDESRAFSIPRARLKIDGEVLDPKIQVLFELGFDYGETELKDFSFDYAFRKDSLYLRAGQGKLPFSRQMMGHSSGLEFMNRSLVYEDPFFNANRDIGLTLHNGERGQGIDWALGVYNGTGTRASVRARGFTQVGTGTAIDIKPIIVDVTDDGDVIIRIDDLDVVDFEMNNVPKRALPVVALRLAYNHGGINLSREADMAGGPLRFSLGLGALVDLDLSDSDSAGLRATADFIAKLHGLSLSGAGFVATEQEAAKGKLKQKVRAFGYYAQLGYNINGLHPMLRASHTIHEVAPDQLEISGGLAWYIQDQNFKLQIHYSQIRTATNDTPQIDQLVQAQLQLVF